MFDVSSRASAVDPASVFIAVLDGPEHAIAYANAAFQTLVGDRPLLGHPVAEALPELVAQGVVDRLDRVYADGEAHRATGVPLQLRRVPDAPLETRTVNLLYEPMPDGSGATRGILVHGVGTAEHTGASLDAPLLLEHSLDVICSIDADGRFVRVSPASLDVWGYRPDELEGRRYMDLVHPDDHHLTEAAAAAILGGQRLYAFENRYIHKDGHVVPLMWSATWSETEQRMLCVARDRTEAKQQEAVLEESQRHFRHAFTYSGFGKALVAADGVLLGVNPALSALVGYPEQELIGRTFQDITHPDDLALDETLWEEVARGERTSYQIEKRYLHRDGHVVWVLLSVSAVRDGDDVFQYFLAGIQDISKAKEALRLAEDRAVALTEAYATLQATTAELERARDDAQAADRAKSQFLAVMSHEIRTPLNSVLGFGELLSDTPLSLEQHEYLDRITENGQSLLRLINDILDLSKIEAGGVELERKPFDLGQLITAVNHTYRPRASAKGLTLTSQIDPGVPTLVLGDEHRLRQVLANYVGNALKFTEQGSVTVYLNATALPPASTSVEMDVPAEMLLHIAVQDTGIGIAEARMDRLFKPFSQIDASTTRKYGGTGLGLVIVRRLAELMGGEAWAEASPGQGSTFHFTARVGVAAPSSTPVRPAAEPLPAIPANLRLLLAEDVESNRALVLATLRRLGLTADLAVDGSQAVGMASTAASAGLPYDVVLMDVQMPVMDGIAATRAIRAALPAAQQPRIIAITADALLGDREKCLAAGMDDYLSKPFSPRRFAETLSRMTLRA